MSYSINEGIDDDTRRLRAMKAVAKRYPETTMRNGRWYAPGSKTDATEVTTVNDASDLIAAATVVDGMFVYDDWASMSVSEMLWTLKKEHPEAYAKVVDVVARRKRSAEEAAR